MDGLDALDEMLDTDEDADEVMDLDGFDAALGDETPELSDDESMDALQDELGLELDDATEDDLESAFDSDALPEAAEDDEELGALGLEEDDDMDLLSDASLSEAADTSYNFV